MEVPAQPHIVPGPISVTKSSSHKFSSLRGIIRIPIKRARGNTGSSELPGGNNVNFAHSHSPSLQASRHNHQQNQQHSRSQSNDYTPPPSAFGNFPYGQHSRSRSLTMKPYMSQPMLGLGHTRDCDGHGGPLDLDGDDTSSYSASPERSPIRQPAAAASTANLQRVAPWTTSSPLRTFHDNHAQKHSKSHSTPGRANNESTAPVANGISSMPNTAQRPAHTRKLSAQSISNVIINTTHAGLAAIGVKSRRMSVDGSSRPQISQPASSRSMGGRMLDSDSRPSTSTTTLSPQDLQPESRQHSQIQVTSSNTQRRKAPSRPLPPEPNEAASTANPPLHATQATSPAFALKPLSTPTKREISLQPNPPTAPTVPHHVPPPSSTSILTSGPRSNILQTSTAKNPAATPQPTPKAVTPQNTIATNYTFPPMRNIPQPNQQQMPGSHPHSNTPSGALAPAATTLTTSRNLPKLPTEAYGSENRPHPPVKRAMTTGDVFRLHLPPINPRLTLNEVLESNSARLSPSVIFRPPPLPLINLPMLTPTLGKVEGVLGGDGSAQVHRTRSLAVGSSASRRMMKAMPALPLQGTSRGTRGHEEVDDMEDDDDDDDMDEEDEEESEEMSTEPRSASTGHSSMDSETSTDDDGNSELDDLPTDEGHTRPSPSSRPSFRWRTMSRNKTSSRSSSYETARGEESNGHIAVEPSPTEPYYGRPERGPDKRFSRVPHLPKVETSGLELDFSIWEQKGMPKTPMGLNATRVQEQQHGRSGVDKGKAKAREGAVSLLGETEMRNAFFGTEDVFQTPTGGIDDHVQNRGSHGTTGEWQKASNDPQSRMVLNGSETLLGGGELKRLDHDVTKSNQAAVAAGTSASPNGTISALPGGGAGMDYFYYRNGFPPQLPPLGPRRDSSRSRSEKTTTSGMSMPDMNHRISTITTTTSSNPSRGTSPLRTPRPSDFRLNINTTTPLSPVLTALPPLVPPKGSEARLSVTMGTLTPHIGLYKMASRSLIDVHGLETKERVEKMMKDEEDAAEREHKTKKRNGKVQAKVLEATAPPVEIHLDEERDVRGPLREELRTPPHSADPVMAGAAKRSSMLNPALRPEPSLDPPKNEETLNRRISAAPAYDAIPHPLRRRRSMPTFNPSTAPPPYPDFSPAMYGLKRDLVILPRDDEGVEKLPPYSNGIYLRAIMPRKMEFTQPGQQAKDRKWRKVLCVLDGTAFKVYNCPAATGVSVIGEWWEKKVGAGDFSEPSNNAHAAGGTSGFRITTDTGRSGGLDEDPSGASTRKSGEGGETGAPVLQRNNSNRPQPSPPHASHSSHMHGHHTSHSVAHASTRSALNLAVQLLKPSPRHGRSHSDVTMNTAPSHSPRASLNLPRSGRTTPTTSPPGSSLRSRSPSTHLTTPASSSASHSSRPTTPSSSISTGAMSASASSSRSGIRVSPSANRPHQSTSSSHSSSKSKGKDKYEVPEPVKSDLIRSYTMQHAESGLGKDYIKRQHVLRVRLEGEQFLLQANNVESVIAWIEGFQSAANVALDLDERPMPAGPIFPRRRRRRRPAPAGSNSTSVSHVINPSPTIPNGPLAGVRPLERSAGRRS